MLYPFIRCALIFIWLVTGVMALSGNAYSQSQFHVTQIRVVKSTQNPVLGYQLAPHPGQPFKVSTGGSFANPATSSIPLDPSPITYASSDAAVATVDARGNAKGASAGMATITASQSATPGYLAAAPISYQLVVYPPTSVTAVHPLVLASVGTPVHITPVTALGGVAPLAFSVVPALPAGLVFDRLTGALGGTPAIAVAAAAHTVTATDALGASSSGSFMLTISGTISTALVVPASKLTLGQAGVSLTPVTAAGGTAPVIWSVVPSLPAGLGLNAATGVITGSPTAPAPAADYTLTVTDANKAVSSQRFSLAVAAGLVTVQTMQATVLTVGQGGVNFTAATATGGAAPLVWSVMPALPAGLGLNTATGAISGVPTLPAAAAGYSLTVTDANQAMSSKTFSLGVNAGLVTTLSVPTTLLTVGQTGVNLSTVTAAGGTAPLTWSVTPALPAGLSLNAATGAISGAPTLPAAAAGYSLTVMDANKATSSKTFSLGVNAGLVTTLSVPTTLLTVGQAGVNLSTVTAAGGTAPLTWSVTPALPAGLSLNTATGTISGVPTLPAAAAGYSLTVMDANKATSSKTFSLGVGAALSTTLSVPTSVLTVGQTGVTLTAVTATGGTAPINWAVAPALPAGLSLNSATGTISGVPTVQTPATDYRLTAMDANKATSSKTFSLGVNAGLVTTLSVATTVLTVGQTGVNLSTVTAAGGAAPLTWSVTPALPAGLSLDPATGTISGAPTLPAAVNAYTLVATDANKATSSKTFSLGVNAGLVTTLSVATTVLTVGQTGVNLAAVTATGGTAPLTWAITPALPAGLGLNAATGTLGGVPTAQSTATEYKLTATDANKATSSKTFSLGVGAGLITTLQVPTTLLTVGQPGVNLGAVTAAGGVAPLTWTVTPALPAGLSLSLTIGSISGVPTVQTPATDYTLTATDANKATSSKTFSLGVGAALSTTLSVPTSVLTVGQTGVTLTAVTATGGTAPISWAVAPALPAGLSLNPATGSINGVPTVQTPATDYTLTATDANKATSSKTFSLGVGAALSTTLSVPTSVLTVGQTGVTLTAATATGGTAPISWTLAPTLPAGLSLNAATGSISGVPTVQTPATDYMLTATDANKATSSKTFSLGIGAALSTTLSIPTSTLTVGQTGVTFRAVTAAGGAAPIGWTVTPVLPAGLSLNPATGTISGAPTAQANATGYTLTATDANKATSSKTFNLAVNAGLSTTLSVPTTLLTVGQTGVNLSAVTATGGAEPISWTVAPTLPAGLSLNPATGAISGVPTVQTPATDYTLTATDANKSTSSKTFSLGVGARITTTLAVPATSLTVGQAGVTFTAVTAAGGAAPIGWTVAPALPAGLGLNAVTGAISGTPTAQASAADYTLTATDANKAASSKTFSLAVNPALVTTLSVPATVLTFGQTGVTFTAVASTGGTAPLAWTVAPALPAGLSLNAVTGAITGIPTMTTATALEYTLTVTDANKATSSKKFSVSVRPSVVTVLSVPVVALTVGQASVTIAAVTATGGTEPLAWTVAPPLPAGLGLNAATGVITGVPTVAAPALDYTLTATDANQAASSRKFSLAVNGTVVATQAVPSKTHDVGDSADFMPIAGTGGAGPLAYQISPALDKLIGLNLDAATGRISGLVQRALGLTTYTVTATDRNGVAAAKTFTLKINGPFVVNQQQPLLILSVGQANVNIVPILGAGGTGAPVYAIAPPLSGGLVFNAASGAITGIPSAVLSNTVYTVTAHDQGTPVVTAANTFSLTVNSSMVATQLITERTFYAGDAVNFTPVTASGGTTPLNYKTVPALANGLAINPSSGAITGVSSGVLVNASFMVMVTDANGIQVGKSFNLTVTGALAIAPVSPNFAITSGVYSNGNGQLLHLTVYSGGVGLRKLTISPPLSAGLNMGGDGLMQGVALAPLGPVLYTVNISDSAVPPHTATTSFTMTVNAPLSLTTVAPSTTLALGSPANISPVVRNGGGSSVGYVTVSFNAATVPPLPAGLVVNKQTGAITGTPSIPSAGTTYTMTACEYGYVGRVYCADAGFSLAVPGALTVVQSVPGLVANAGQAVSFIPLLADGGSGQLTYSIKPALPQGLTLNTRTGAVTGAAAVAQAATQYTVSVNDSALPLPASVNRSFTLTVNAALNVAQTTGVQYITPGASINMVPNPASGGTLPYQYSITPALANGLVFNGSTGALAGTVSADANLSNMVYTVSVMDGAGATASNTFLLASGGPLTMVVSQVLNGVTVGRPAGVNNCLPIGFSTGGFGAVRYSISPDLPPGLTMATGDTCISGMPTVVTPLTNYTVTVIDSATPVPGRATATYAFATNAKVAMTTIVPVTTLPLGTPAAFTPIRALGGTKLVFDISPALPASLTFNSTSTEITGTPKVASPMTIYVVAARDAGILVGYLNFQLQTGTLTAIQNIPDKKISRGGQASFIPVSGVNGVGAFIYGISPALPAGLVLDTSTGAIAGSAATEQGPTEYLVSVRDSAVPTPSTASKTFRLTVNPALAFSQASASAVQAVGDSVNVTPANPIGGVAPYAFSIAPALGNGLSLNAATGSIGGTASSPLTAKTYILTVTDAGGGTASAPPFSLTIHAQLLATVQTPFVSLMTGQQASFTPITAGGGTGTLAYAASPALPAGLAMDPASGKISGMPASPMATAQYTVTITDTAQPAPHRATAVFGLAIVKP